LYVLVFVVLMLVCINAEAGPGMEEPGHELDVDEAYTQHVSSLLSAISLSEGKSDVKYSDLKPQVVDVHTIAPRVPMMRVGMNALGHKMMHVHSDEHDGFSAEILSSGATAGFTFTDRVKGLQKGDGTKGSQWTLYSSDKIFRVKDEAGDLLQIEDGLMTLQGNQQQKPRFTVVGGTNSVPRITLVSKTEDNSAQHISLYNRYGKFGIFSGVQDKSVFHITADGSEMSLTTDHIQPHLTIESLAKSETSQEVVFKGHDSALKMFHKNSNLGFCKLATDGTKCDTFLQASTDGESIDFISQRDAAKLTLSHKIRGGDTELQLLSQDKMGDLTGVIMYNQEGTIGFRSDVKNVKRELLTIKPTGEATVHGKFEVLDDALFKRGAHFGGNLNVEGVVTMHGKSVSTLFDHMEATKRQNLLMTKRVEEMEEESREFRNRMVEMQQSSMLMKEKMERMMSTLSLMQETTEMSH